LLQAVVPSTEVTHEHSPFVPESMPQTSWVLKSQ
jgi:hypothetical protein